MKEEKTVNLSVVILEVATYNGQSRVPPHWEANLSHWLKYSVLNTFFPLKVRLTRSGSTMSTTGGGPDHHGYSWSDSKDPAVHKHNWTDINKTGKLLTEFQS